MGKLKSKKRSLHKSSRHLLFVSLFLTAVPLILVAVILQASKQQSQTQVHAASSFTCATGDATGATSTRIFDVTKSPYNAVGNGTTDNASRIQKAINDASAAGGGIVTFPAGTFMVNKHLLLKTNVKMQGTGLTTIIKAGPSFLSTKGPNGGYPLITTNGAKNVTLAGFMADQSGNTLNGNVSTRLNEYLIDVRGSTNAIVTDVTTRNPFTYSIAVVDSTKFCIQNNNTQVATSGKYNQLDGIHILNSSFGDVINNTVDQRYNGATDGDDGLVAHTINGSVHDITYAGNKVRGGSNGAGMQLAYTAASDQIYNLLIQNNEFWGSPEGIHTGIYGTSGSAYNITIGGSAATANNFHDNGGNAVDLEGSLSNITVTDNIACNSGVFNVGPGNGNVVANNTTTCSTTTTVPTTSPLPTPTPSPQPTSTTTITVYAAGTPASGAYPTMKLLINNQIVKTWTNVQGNPSARVFQQFTYQAGQTVTANQIKIQFTNDAASRTQDRNLFIDKITLNNTVYQTEASTVYSQGSTKACSNGYNKTEGLYCNGYFQYQ